MRNDLHHLDTMCEQYRQAAHTHIVISKNNSACHGLLFFFF